MAHPYWPLFDLRVRTPRVELRYPSDDDCIALAAVAAQGIHDPDWLPFTVAWTDAPSPELERNALKHWWGLRAATTPDAWVLPMAVSVSGRLVGIQAVSATAFTVTKAVSTGSWLGRAFQGQGIGKEMRSAVLHLAFAGLGAEVAYTGAWHDNPASLGVTRALGYEPNGEEVMPRRGVADRQLKFRLTLAGWSERRQRDIEIEALEPCLEMLGARGARSTVGAEPD